jgi:hypothetical protein
MKKVMLLTVVMVLSQFVLAQNKQSAPKTTKVDGCIYADIVYQPGDKHRVQESIMDPVTHKVILRDAEPELWQECIENTVTDSKTSPRFYWKTLASSK